MIAIGTSAPGKVIVAGEYAVLVGAPAICMAVNVRARVRVCSNQGQHCAVTSPGFTDGEARFATLRDSGRTFPLLAAVVEELQAGAVKGLDLLLDTTGFSRGGAGKIGIGSSAALTVALAAALLRATGRQDGILNTAMAAHRRFQNGAGSGADVATSSAGGVIEYRMDEKTVQERNWPRGLSYRLFWSGVPADTLTRLNKFGAGAQREARATLVPGAEAVARTWRDGDAGSIMTALGEWTGSLQRFDTECGLGIFAAGHGDLSDLAASRGVVYKPCGAGGGDLGLALASDEEALAGFSDAASQAGFQALDLALDTAGLDIVDAAS